MNRYIDAEYVKAVMINDRLMQGNAEFNLYAQQVEIQVKAMPSIDIVRCKECKYSDESLVEGCVYCNETDRAMDENGFCHKGEREGE